MPHSETTLFWSLVENGISSCPSDGFFFSAENINKSGEMHQLNAEKYDAKEVIRRKLRLRWGLLCRVR